MSDIKQVYKGLRISCGTDGHWLRFEKDNGLSGAINLENYADAKGIIGSALLDWGKQTYNDGVVVMDTERVPEDTRNRAVSVAVTLSFLARGIDDRLTAIDSNVGYADFFQGNFGGHDGFVHELYPYAEALQYAWDNRDSDLEASGVFDYEISEELAAELFMNLTIDRQRRWAECCARLINIWCSAGCDRAAEYVASQKEIILGGLV